MNKLLKWYTDVAPDNYKWTTEEVREEKIQSLLTGIAVGCMIAVVIMLLFL